MAIGAVYGVRGVADYTYALSVCAPLYFVAGFSFPVFLLVVSSGRTYSRNLLWIRIVSALATVPLFGAAALAMPSTQANVVFVVWLIKVGELLFDPLPAILSADDLNQRRGRQLLAIDFLRVFLAQTVLWYGVLKAEWGIVRTLAAVGGCSIAVNLVLLALVPTWSSTDGMQRLRDALKRLASTATPMTLSGALLALLVSLPRLLAEPLLTQDQRALFGVAQVLSAGVAILFHSIWLYDLHKIRTFASLHQMPQILKANARLSMLFLALLAAGSAVVASLQGPLLGLFRVPEASPLVFSLLFAALGLQHCISLYRDALKFVGRQWTEVRILLIALVAATATFYAGAYGAGLHWVWTIAFACFGGSAVQAILSIIALKRQSISVTGTARA